MNEWIEEIKRLVMDAMQISKKLLQNEYLGQGHKASGALVNTMETRVNEMGTQIIGELLVNRYALYLENRRSPGSIPYSRGSGATTSKFISSLQNWWMGKGLSPREALSASFATAASMKRHGSPTPRAFAFSTNGRRTGAIAEAFKLENLTPINEILLSEKLVAIFQRGVVEGLAQAA